MSQSAKTPGATQKDAGSLYLEALTHVEKLVEAQPLEEDKSAWRKWARELINYENKTLSPREKRAPRLTKYSDGTGERFLAVMKAIDLAEKRLKSGSGEPSSSGESEPDETSTTRRSARRMAGHVTPNGHPAEKENDKETNNSLAVVVSAQNLTDAGKTINYEIPCSRCARAGIACAGKEGRACFTCRAHRQGCDLSSRAIREKARAEGSDKEAEGQESASTATGRRSAMGKEKDKKDAAKDKERETVESESVSVSEGRESRPRRAATLVSNPRVGSPKTVAQLRTGASISAQRKRRATDADISVASSVPSGPSPSKRARPIHIPVQHRYGDRTTSNGPDYDREEVRDALLVCEAAYRQLRKALRL